MLYSSIILSSHIPSSFFPNKKHKTLFPFSSHPTFLSRPPQRQSKIIENPRNGDGLL